VDATLTSPASRVADHGALRREKAPVWEMVEAVILNRPGFCGGSQSTGEWDDGSSTEVSGRAA